MMTVATELNLVCAHSAYRRGDLQKAEDFLRSVIRDLFGDTSNVDLYDEAVQLLRQVQEAGR